MPQYGSIKVTLLKKLMSNNAAMEDACKVSHPLQGNEEWWLSAEPGNQYTVKMGKSRCNMYILLRKCRHQSFKQAQLWPFQRCLLGAFESPT